MTPAQIQTLRDQLGWTQKKLAEKCGVTIRTVIRWEMGQSPPTGAGAMLLARTMKRAEKKG